MRDRIGVLFLGVLLNTALQTMAGTIIYQEDFSNFKSGAEALRVVESGHPEFPQALELRSIKGPDGKIRQGSWQLPLGKTDTIAQSSVMEIRFWMNAATESARYGLLANDSSYKAITFIQDNGFFHVPKKTGWGWEKAAKIKIGHWHKILYRIDFPRGVFDVFIDDMEKATVQNMPFRDSQALFINRIWTLGSESTESQTLFGPITVSLIFPKEFPPESFNGAPYFLKGVGWTTNTPTPETFAQSIPLVLGTASETVKEAARLRLLRDQTNLYCLFRLDAQDMTRRTSQVIERDGKIWADDCFEVFIQPDVRQDTYYHFAGNASGARYDAKHQSGVGDAGWNGHWSSQINKDEGGWTALITIPFADLGSSLPENMAWGFDAGRENPYTREVLSWTIPERFGKLYFPEVNDPRPLRQRVADVMDPFYGLADRLKALSNQLERAVPFEHPLLLEAQQRLRERLKSILKDRDTAASAQAFVRIDDVLLKLTDDMEALQHKAAQMADLFKPDSEGRRRTYAACVESSMTKVMDTYCGSAETGASLLLSGNEYGSFQVVLLALAGHAFQGVKMTISPLKNSAGHVLEHTRQHAFLVESVRTAIPNKNPANYPDVLRPGSAFHFENRVLVPLWFDVYLPPDTPAGTYQAQIKIQPENRDACVIPVTIEATGLTLPSSASLDTAFCFAEAWVKEFYGQDTPPEKMRGYCKFILEHRLEPMNLWSGKDVDIGLDTLDYSAQHGKTMLFLPIRNLRKDKTSYQELIKRYQGKLRPVFFGHDEVLSQNSPEKLAAMKTDFGIAKELFPEVPRLNTALIDERLFGYVDIWCPLFRDFDAADSAGRIRLGEKVWWYPTDYPLAPYANFNLDSPGIDPRIIPWMNWKLNISGLLYWGLNREWLTNTPKEVGRMTPEFIKQRSLEWLTPEVIRKMAARESRWPELPWMPYFRSVSNDKSVSATNGGGNLLYPGPDWEPWPSTRLKNLRDGMQDYEYFVMLKKNVVALKIRNPQHPLVATAEKALLIANDVVGGETSYTKNPERLLAFRRNLITLVKETEEALH